MLAWCYLWFCSTWRCDSRLWSLRLVLYLVHTDVGLPSFLWAVMKYWFPLQYVTVVLGCVLDMLPLHISVVLREKKKNTTPPRFMDERGARWVQMQSLNTLFRHVWGISTTDLIDMFHFFQYGARMDSEIGRACDLRHHKISTAVAFPLGQNQHAFGSCGIS